MVGHRALCTFVDPKHVPTVIYGGGKSPVLFPSRGELVLPIHYWQRYSSLCCK